MEYKENQIRTDVRKDRQKGQTMRTPKASASTRVTKRAKATKKAAVIQLRPALPETVTEIITNWHPRPGSEAEKCWDEIGPVVRSHLLAQSIQGPSLAQKYVRALAHHAASRHSLGHAITKAEDLFNDSALATTYGVSVISSRASQTLRGELLFMKRMRANLLPDRYGKSEELTHPRTKVADPYTQTEINQMLGFARGRSSMLCIKQQGALLLSLGAGLTSAELSNARGSDLISTPWGLFIDTQGLPGGGNRGPRQVPILAAYEDELSALANEIGDDLFLGTTIDGVKREPGALSSRASRGPYFKTNRARSTWMRNAIAPGASFLALRQAGVAVASDKHLATLSKGLELGFDQYVKQMRGCPSAFDQIKHNHLLQYAVGQ
jgi:hypothetical protein